MELSVSDRRQWRSWLRKNHARESEVWLAYYKKHTGKESVSYGESVEEAICFGWIDGLKRRLDDERYAHRFTPRKPGSKWSPQNIEIAGRMIAEGKMTKAGLAAFEAGRPYEQAFLENRAVKEMELAPEVEKTLRANKKAWRNFNNLAPGYRKQYVAWINAAKRQSTIDKRVAEAVTLLEKNMKLGMR